MSLKNIKGIILNSIIKKNGENVKIKIILGPYVGSVFNAIKFKDEENNFNIYEVEINKTKTYFLDKDIIVF